MFKKILVPLDGSETAEAILPFVREIAQRTDGELIVATAVQQVGVWDATLTLQVMEKEEEMAQQYLGDKVGELTAAGCKAQPRVTRGDAAEAILSLADEEEVDPNRHQHTWAVGHRALSLRQRRHEDPPGGEPAGPVPPAEGGRGQRRARPGRPAHPRPPRRLRAFPQRAAPDRGLRNGDGRFAHPLPRRLADHRLPRFEMSPVAVGSVIEESQEYAKTLLASIAEGVEARGVEATTVVVLDTATDGVLHAADELNIDLIAIGTHGHGGFKRMVSAAPPTPSSAAPATCRASCCERRKRRPRRGSGLA